MATRSTGTVEGLRQKAELLGSGTVRVQTSAGLLVCLRLEFGAACSGAKTRRAKARSALLDGLGGPLR